jgi:hypothetical protein
MNMPIKYGPRDSYKEVWGVQSDSNPNKIYTVTQSLASGNWACSCPRWTLNKNRPVCKHIERVFDFRNGRLVPETNAEMPESVKKAISRFSMLDV